MNGGGWGPRAPRGCLGPAVGGRAGVLGCRGTALALEASGGGTPRAPLGARPRPPRCLLRLPESPSRWPAVLSSTAPARRSPAPGWPLAAGASPVRGLSRKPAPVRRPSCRPGAALPGAPGASRARCGLPARVRRSPPPPRRWRCVVTRGRRRLPPPPTPAGRVPALARACPGRGSGPRRPLAVGRPRPRARLPGGGEGFGLRPGAPPPSRVSACSARCRPRRDRRASPSPARGPPPPPSGPSGGGEGGG